jgi:hydrogenase expression/formation protein HypE
MKQFPDAGKIHDEFFKSSIYPFCGSPRDEVIAPPQYGVDVSIINLPNGYDMALTSDPLTLIPTMGLRESAWLSVHLMANDMATTGKAPMYAQFVLNLPSTLSVSDFDNYWKHIHTFCKDMGTAITGGHTGRFEGQNSTVAGGGTMISIAPQGEMITSKGATAGDVIIVTKESALIATSVLALSFPETIKNKCGVEVQHKASELFYKTSALQDGLTAATLNSKEDKAVTAMHDVTEGGVLGAIYEMALASDRGVMVDEGRLPTGDVQQQVCNLFNIDPHYCVGPGSMIIAVKENAAELLVDTLKAKGIEASSVGRFVNKEKGMLLSKDGKEQPIIHPGTDPYWKAFYTAFAQGLK